MAVMLGLAMVPLGLGAGAAVDFARALQVRTILQGAADAAAIAGGTSRDKSDAALQQIVEQYLEINGAKDALQYVGEIKQELNEGKGTLTVSIDGTIPSSFMRLAGFSDMDIGASSEVNVGSQALELALVLDNTGSMSGTKIINLRSAATNLVNIIQSESSSYADVKMAVVPFAEYVNIGPFRGGEAWVDKSYLGGQPFSGCVGSRRDPQDQQVGAIGGGYPGLSGVRCNVELLPLTTNLDAVKSRIASMVAVGATYVPTGLMWGWNVLDSQVPFAEGRTAADMKRINGRKAIVLMTDGENTISPTYPTHDGRDVATSNTSLEEMCSKVKMEGIQIFTVSFMVPTDTIKDILIGCASAPSQYFDADNSTELNAAFTQIARELAAIRLTH